MVYNFFFSSSRLHSQTAQSLYFSQKKICTWRSVFECLLIPAEHFLKLLHPSICTHETTPEQLNKFVGACHFYLKSVSVNG
jgi:hypothetical protein